MYSWPKKLDKLKANCYRLRMVMFSGKASKISMLGDLIYADNTSVD
jgi:hypothetical protein